MHWLRKTSWPPYVVGALLGVLSWFAFASAESLLGVSTTFVRAAGMAENAVAPEHVAGNSYFTKTGLVFDWQFALVVGVLLGALVSSRLSGDHGVEKVPPLWARRFGNSVALRYAAALAGGAMLMFGARLAGGCTSGHGISGALQLAVSSWVFLVTIFAAGIATALALFHKEPSHV
jgi:uncharacterized membrane protein YedE/YeeE